MKPYIELVSFRTKPEVPPDRILAAAGEVNIFLRAQEGFVARYLGYAEEDGLWHDILFWDSRGHLLKAMENAAASPHCVVFFRLIDKRHDKMALYPSRITVVK